MRVPHHDIEHLIGTAVGDLLHLEMEEFRNILQLVFRHGGEGRHALVREALADVWNQFFSVVVAQDLVRCDQAGRGRAASLRSMAECAILAKERRAKTFQRNRIVERLRVKIFDGWKVAQRVFTLPCRAISTISTAVKAFT